MSKKKQYNHTLQATAWVFLLSRTTKNEEGRNANNAMLIQ
jgi:hypothetical protein